MLKAGYVVYSASTSFFIPFLITFLLYSRIFVVLRHRLAAMRVRRQRSLPPEVTSSRTTVTESSVWPWRLRRRKRDLEQKRDVGSTLVAELSEDDKSSSGGLEVLISIHCESKNCTIFTAPHLTVRLSVCHVGALCRNGQT